MFRKGLEYMALRVYAHAWIEPNRPKIRPTMISQYMAVPRAKVLRAAASPSGDGKQPDCVCELIGTRLRRAEPHTESSQTLLHTRLARGNRSRDRLNSSPVMASESPVESRNRWPASLAAGGLLLVLAVAAHWPAMHAAFIWDDDYYVKDNALLTQPGGLADIWAVNFSGDDGLTINTPQYYPLVFTSYWVEYRLWGDDPVGYHAVNIALHALCALLAWLVARRLGLPGAWFIAALFAVHPVHVESVAWAAERKNVLSGFFFLASLLAFLRCEGRGHAWWYGLSLLCFAAAVLSKSVAVILPVALLLVAWQQRGKLRRGDLLRVLPMFVLAFAFGVLTLLVESGKAELLDTGWQDPLWYRLVFILPRAMWFYAGKLLWPVGLVLMYPRWHPDPGTLLSYVPLAALLIVAVTLWLLRRRVGWGPLLLAVFVVLNVAPGSGPLFVAFHRFSYAADHFNYLGSLGYLTLLVGGTVLIGRRLFSPGLRGRVGLTLGAVAVLALAPLTWRQASLYREPATIWQHTLDVNPEAFVAMTRLGSIHARGDDFAEAEELYKRAMAYPIVANDAARNLGYVYLETGRAEQAAELHRQYIADHPDSPDGYRNLAEILTHLGWPEGACEALAAVADREDSAEALTSLALQQERLNRLDLALVNLKRAAAHDPKYATVWVAQARIFWNTGRYDDALRTCERGLREVPDEPRLLYRLAWLLATCPDDAVRDETSALQVAQRLVALTGTNLRSLDTLAAAQAANGQYAEAAALAEQALPVARGANARYAAEIAERLKLYKAGQPYRAPRPTTEP